LIGPGPLVRAPLEAERKSFRAIDSYTSSLRIFEQFYCDHDYPTTVATVSRCSTRAFMAM
jgi:hypothetical protein